MTLSRTVMIGSAAALGVAAATGHALELADRRRDRRAWRMLSALKRADECFEEWMVRDLTKPARRFFLHAIEPGTRLCSGVELVMEGEFSLGDFERRAYQTMKATEILRAPRGFVWCAEIGAHGIGVSGADGYLDGEAWTSFWLGGVTPVAHASDHADIARSAAARMFAEALIWTPAALLPSPTVSWIGLSPHMARVTIEHEGEPIWIDLQVEKDGRPVAFSMRRWSNANPEHHFGWESFGGFFRRERSFGGYRVPVEVEVGNRFGTAGYFPFFKAEITGARYF